MYDFDHIILQHFNTHFFKLSTRLYSTDFVLLYIFFWGRSNLVFIQNQFACQRLIKKKLIVLDERKYEKILSFLLATKFLIGYDLNWVPKPSVIKYPEITGYIKDFDGDKLSHNN